MLSPSLRHRLTSLTTAAIREPIGAWLDTLGRIGRSAEVTVLGYRQAVLAKASGTQAVAVHEPDEQTAGHYEHGEQDPQRPRSRKREERQRYRQQRHEEPAERPHSPSGVGEFVAHPFGVVRRQPETDREAQPAPGSGVTWQSAHAPTLEPAVRHRFVVVAVGAVNALLPGS